MLSNKWTNTLSRSFQSIRTDMISALKDFKDKEGKPLITDLSEGNIFVIIISLFAAIAEVLHYYIDNMAREAFLTTARKYSSVVNQGLLVDYHAHLANPATVDVILSRELQGANTGAKVNIPKGLVFIDIFGNHWENTQDVKWDNNSSNCILSLVQHEFIEDTPLNNQIYPGGNLILENNLGDSFIEHKGVQLTLNNDTWTQVDTFAYSKPTDKHFMVTIDESSNPIIIFGDGKFGKIPDVGQKITVKYYVTKGEKGNINSNSIIKVPSSLTTILLTATCNNPNSAGDGKNYEDMELLRSHVAIQARTMGIIVTRNDLIDCVKSIPGIKDAKLEEIFNRKLNLYISPSTGDTTVSSEMISKVSNIIQDKNMLANRVTVKSAGVSKIHLSLNITGKPSYKSSQIYNEVLMALYDSYSGNTSKIGGNIRVSDIYALLDNLPSVDYLYINKFFISPWPKIIKGDIQLDLELNDIEKANGSMTYLITMGVDNTFNLRSTSGNFVIENQQISNNILIEDTKNGFKFSISIKGTYNLGSRYEFTISEPNVDYKDTGFNQIVFNDPSLLNTNIKETL